jgi:hypothetical protein
MSTNPIQKRLKTEPSLAVPSDEDERRKFWIDRGNRILWGQEPTSKGDFLQPRTDLQWACVNGNYFIEPRR